MDRTTRLLFLLVVSLLLVGCDQATKLYAIANLEGQPQQTYLGDTVRIQYVENKGAFLSLMADWTRESRFLVLTLLNAGVLVGLAAYTLIRPQVDRWSITAFALILAGGLGNLIDRVRLDGIVVDFLNVGIGPLRTGIFNVADVAIMAGFFVLVYVAFFGPSADDASDAPAAAAVA